jgi:hypothetical protein
MTWPGTPGRITTICSPVHSQNALHPISATLGGIVSSLRLEHPKKAASPTCVTVSGISIDFKVEQPVNAQSPITSPATPTRWIATLAREEQSQNAPWPTVAHPSPSVTEARDPQNAKP